MPKNHKKDDAFEKDVDKIEAHHNQKEQSQESEKHGQILIQKNNQSEENGTFEGNDDNLSIKDGKIENEKEHKEPKTLLKKSINKAKKIYHDMLGSIDTAKKFLFATNIDNLVDHHKVEEELEDNIKKPIRVATISMLVFLSVFFIWGNIAKLNSAVAARGVIILEGQKQNIQYPYVGVITDIYVKDGDFVKKNQKLIKLNQSDIESEVKIYLNQVRVTSAILRRLKAEYNQDKEIDFSNDGNLDLNSLDVQNIILGQKRLFESRKSEYDEKIKNLESNVARFKGEYEGSKRRLTVIREIAANREEKMKFMKELLDQNAVSKNDYLNALNEYNSSKNEEFAIETSMKSAYESEIAYNGELQSYKGNWKARIAEEQRSIEANFKESLNKYHAAMDRYKRTSIVSPVDGIITGLKHYTIGGVIQPSDVIASVVTKNDELIIEAYIQTQDINNIFVGSKAKIQLDPFKQRLVPKIDGEVIYVSADKMVNERQQQGMPLEYYTIRLKFDDSKMKEHGIYVKPGMPATVFIVRGELTFLQIITAPMVESASKALIEQ